MTARATVDASFADTGRTRRAPEGVAPAATDATRHSPPGASRTALISPAVRQGSQRSADLVGLVDAELADASGQKAPPNRLQGVERRRAHQCQPLSGPERHFGWNVTNRPCDRRHDHPGEHWHRLAIFVTNLKGAVLMVCACVPVLERSGRGRVILTSSILGPVTGYPGWSYDGATRTSHSTRCAPPPSSWRSSRSQ